MPNHCLRVDEYWFRGTDHKGKIKLSIVVQTAANIDLHRLPGVVESVLKRRPMAVIQYCLVDRWGHAPITPQPHCILKVGTHPAHASQEIK